MEAASIGETIRAAVRAGLYLGGVLQFETTVLLFVLLYGSVSIRRFFVRRNPEAEVCVGLVFFAHLAEHPNADWVSVRFRRRMLVTCEGISSNFELISDQLTTANTDSNRQAAQVLKRIAAGFRDVIPALITPRADTNASLRARLASNLESFATGDWDSLPQIDIPPAQRAPLWRGVASRIWSGAVGSAVSIGVITFLQRQGLLQDGTPVTALPVVAYILAAVTILVAIDPLVSSKVAVLKEMAGMLKGGGKEGEPARHE